ncbi:hypothetical protein PF003_g24562 [Phytophthora fragariae]|nr:hypothetical protein PF003_g24562 [Phytophthora fragariae]
MLELAAWSAVAQGLQATGGVSAHRCTRTANGWWRCGALPMRTLQAAGAGGVARLERLKRRLQDGAEVPRAL